MTLDFESDEDDDLLGESPSLDHSDHTCCSPVNSSDYSSVCARKMQTHTHTESQCQGVDEHIHSHSLNSQTDDFTYSHSLSIQGSAHLLPMETVTHAQALALHHQDGSNSSIYLVCF